MWVVHVDGYYRSPYIALKSNGIDWEIAPHQSKQFIKYNAPKVTIHYIDGKFVEMRVKVFDYLNTFAQLDCETGILTLKGSYSPYFHHQLNQEMSPLLASMARGFRRSFFFDKSDRLIESNMRDGTLTLILERAQPSARELANVEAISA